MKMSLCCKTLILFILCSNLSHLSAQSECDDNWPPGLNPRLIEKLNSCCSSYINIDKETLNNFFKKEAAKDYDPTIKAPCPILSSPPLANEVSFVWEAVPEASKYTIRYLNLNTGKEGLASTEETQFSLPTGQDHFLFLFSTTIQNEKGKDRRSGNFIIIDEKLIILTLGSGIQLREQETEDNNIKNQSTFQQLKLYPNPSAGMAFLEYEITSADLVSIQLISTEGKVLRELQASTWQSPGLYQVRISNSWLPSGLYYCRIKTQSTAFDQPMLKN